METVWKKEKEILHSHINLCGEKYFHVKKYIRMKWYEIKLDGIHTATQIDARNESMYARACMVCCQRLPH
jgi:hypothetical protein